MFQAVYADESPPQFAYTLIAEQSHPAHLFTQGLLVDGPWIYESSGGYNKSLLARYKASDTSLLVSKRLPRDIFAEGLTLLDDRFYLLTWRRGQMLIFDRNWNRVGQEYYVGEGWGLTHNGEQLIMSDGSDRLHFYQPSPLKKTHSITVTGGDQRWSAINELEYVNGVIWANRWFSNDLIAIDPADGRVLAQVNLEALTEANAVGQRSHEKVLNGLAWSAEHQAMWVTGKLWSKRYLLELPNLTLALKQPHEQSP